MKNSAIKWVVFTTIYVFAFGALTQLSESLKLLIPILIAGQFLILFMVYKVLTDNFHSTKNFDDWYEDCPKI